MFFGIRWKRLSLKIIAWSFVPTALILLGAGLFAFWAFRAVAESLVIESNREITHSLASDIPGQLSDLALPLIALSHQPDIYASDPPSRRAALTQSSRELADYDGGVILLDRLGTVIATEPPRPDLIGQVWSDRPYLRDIALSSDPVFSDIVNDGPRQSPVVVVALRITGDRGEFAGILAGMFQIDPSNPSPFEDAVSKLANWPGAGEELLTGHGQAQAVYLVDRNGRVLYHSNRERIGEDMHTRPAVQRVSTGKTGPLSSTDYRDQSVVTYFVPVPKVGWGLVVEQERGSVLGFYEWAFRIIGVMFALAVVLPSVVVALGITQITRPIQRLISATQDVASGKFGRTIQVRTGDELEELATHFNRMSSQLADSYAALQAREERLALVIQGTNDGIWDWDLRTNDVYFSPRWKSMLGYADDEIANRFEAWRSLIHPDDLQSVLQILVDYLAGTSPAYSVEHRLRHKDGSYRWVLARGTALRDAQGEPYRMAGTHTDVTERIEAEEAIRQSEKRFAQVFHTSAIAITITTLGEGRYVDVNDAWLALFGYTREEVLGDSSLRMNLWVHPEERALMIEQLKTKGQARGFEHLARTKSGEIRSVLVSAEVLELNNERFNLSLVLDITERKRAEEALRASESNMRSLMESAKNFAVFRIAVDSSSPYLARTLIVSPSLKEIVGIPNPEDFSSWFEAIHPEDRARAFEANRRSIAEGLPFDEKVRFCREHGQCIWAHIRSMPVADAQGRVTHFNGLVIDITDQKVAEEELQQAYATLERRVDERTRELSALNAIAGLASRSLDLKEVMGAVLDKVLQIMGMEFGGGYRLDGNIEKLPEVAMPGAADAQAFGRQLMNWARAARPERAAGTANPDLFSLEPLAYRGFTDEFIEKSANRLLPGTDLAVAYIIGQPYAWQVEEGVTDRVLKALLEKEEAQQIITVPLVAKGKLVGAFHLGTRKTRTLTPEQLSLLSAVGQQVGLAMENARLFEAEQARRAEAERRRQVAEGLRGILAVLNSNQSLLEIMNYILSQSARLLGAHSGLAFHVDEEGKLGYVEASYNLPSDIRFDPGSPIDSSSGNQVWLGGQPLGITDWPAYLQACRDDPNWIVSPGDRAWFEWLAERYSSRLIVPLLVKDKVAGGLAFNFRERREFTEEDYRLGISLADQAALAIENARLRAQAEQSAAFAERSRLARELHDSVTQSLYSVTLYAEAAARLLSGGRTSEAAEHLRELRDTSQEALREMRLLIFELRPLALEKTGLAAALQARLDGVEVRGGIQANLSVTGEEQLSPRVQEELYHIAQEALNNVLKHAHAQHVRVALEFRASETVLDITDDGQGFVPAQAHDGGGLGLRGMQERVQKLGAGLAIASEPGHGTKITVRVPVSNYTNRGSE